MDKITAGAIMLALFVLVVAVMAWGWRGRKRRQAGVGRPPAVPEGLGAPLAAFDALYVATTVRGDPLDRIAVAGLGFRSWCRLEVHPQGVVVGLTAEPDFLIATAEVLAAERATWTIDRVVEPGGLIQLSWRLGGDEVATYFRFTGEGAAEEFLRNLPAHTREQTSAQQRGNE